MKDDFAERSEVIEFSQGTQIAYVPAHANGDMQHECIEYGFVFRKHNLRSAYWCRFWNKNKTALRTLANSELVNTSDLVQVNSVPQKMVNDAIREIS